MAPTGHSTHVVADLNLRTIFGLNDLTISEPPTLRCCRLCYDRLCYDGLRYDRMDCVMIGCVMMDCVMIGWTAL